MPIPKIQAIGIIRTPFVSLENMPIQPGGGQQTLGSIILDKQYQPGLADLDGFSHLFLLYAFHMASRTALSVTPFMDTTPRGVFATRSPLRPNHLGLSIVELVSIEDNIITIRGIDVLDGTPLLDIKPYIAAFDAVRQSRSGWMKGSAEEVATARSDSRFVG
jgi:tRNA-Thr(GGU) m(6)t(6)A37 methyltransferase TsaA